VRSIGAVYRDCLAQIDRAVGLGTTHKTMADAKTIYDLPSPTQDKLLSEHQEASNFQNSEVAPQGAPQAEAAEAEAAESAAPRKESEKPYYMTLEEVLTHPKFSDRFSLGGCDVGYSQANITKIDQLISENKFLGWRALLHPKIGTLDEKTTNDYARIVKDYIKMVADTGGDPLTPEIYGGLSLEYIYRYMYNSGETAKKNVPPLYFYNRKTRKYVKDSGRNKSNVFIRVYRIVNDC